MTKREAFHDRSTVLRSVDVLTAARKRFDWIFAEFDNVKVSWSGGKDSTVVLHLALEAAERAGRLPLTVMFLDQEAEWQATADLARTLLDDPRISFEWYQVPLRINNSAGLKADNEESESWLQCWDPNARDVWMREQESEAITVSPCRSTGFHRWLGEYECLEPCAIIAGMRAEESPGRRLALLTYPAWKHVTWGRKGHCSQSVRLDPIFDWSWRDVWKAIHEFEWPYNRIYDQQYQHGIGIREMRVSSLIHSTAVGALYYVHEFEPETWARLCRRLPGIGTTHHLSHEEMFRAPKELPYMFSTWREYRDHLLENLASPDLRPALRAACNRLDKLVANGSPYDTPSIVRSQINGILSGFSTAIDNRAVSMMKARQWQKQFVEDQEQL